MTSQLWRASASVPANIAEGCGRTGDAELARFPGIGLGSAAELDPHLLLVHDLGYRQSSDYERLAFEAHGVGKMLAAFVDRLHHPSTASQRPTNRSQ